VQASEEEADSIVADVLRLGGRVIAGLRSVHMVCSTALANGLDTSAVQDAVNAAARDRGKLFADKHREELEGWLLGNKLFRSLYDGPPLATPNKVSLPKISALSGRDTSHMQNYEVRLKATGCSSKNTCCH
jgi:hypothetical protein